MGVKRVIFPQDRRDPTLGIAGVRLIGLTLSHHGDGMPLATHFESISERGDAAADDQRVADVCHEPFNIARRSVGGERSWPRTDEVANLGPMSRWARTPSGLLVAALALWPASAFADLYSWVDGEGVIHLTNVRPNANYKPYQADEAEGFGGERPIVVQMPGGKKRVLYRVNVTRYDEIFRRAADHYKLPFAFIKAVAKVESNFNPLAVSHANAKGMMQLIDSTAAAMSVKNPFDAEQNIFGGTRYLRLLANQFDGNMALVAAAYNSGPERVRRLGRIPRIRETQRYVRRVLQMYRHYRGKGS